MEDMELTKNSNISVQFHTFNGTTEAEYKLTKAGAADLLRQLADRLERGSEVDFQIRYAKNTDGYSEVGNYKF